MLDKSVVEHTEIIDHLLLPKALKAAIHFGLEDVKARMALAGVLFALTGFVESMDKFEAEVGDG